MFASVIATLYAFGGLLLGGVIGFLTRHVPEQKKYSLYTFSAGVLIGLLIFELVPETFADTHFFGPALGIILGILLMRVLDILFNHAAQGESEQQFFQVFVFLSIAIGIHNIPTGIALGSALANQQSEALVLLLAIIIHHIPEGVALMILLTFTRFKLLLFVGTVLVVSIILGTGIVAGSIIHINSHLQDIIMGAAIGSIGYVTVHEMLGKVKQRLDSIPFMLFLLLGIGTVQLYTYIFPHQHV